MTNSTDGLLNQIVQHIRDVDVPECPDPFLTSGRRAEVEINRSNRLAPISVVLALTVLAAAIVVSVAGPGLNRSFDQKLAGGSDVPTTLPIDDTDTDPPAMAVSLPGLLRRTEVGLVEGTDSDPKQNLRQGLHDLDAELQDLARRADLLHIRDQVDDLQIALRDMVAVIR